MAISNTVLVDAGQEAANIFACASTNGDAITTMYFCNTNNIVYYNKVITAGDTYIIDWEKLVLNTGDTIRANANIGNAIVATVSTIGL